jgi:hypothetical protein
VLALHRMDQRLTMAKPWNAGISAGEALRPDDDQAP